MAAIDLFGGGGGIKSLQRGKTAFPDSVTSVLVTVSAVDMSKARLRICGVKTTSSSDFRTMAVTGEVYSATQLRFEKGVGGANTTTVSWELEESF